MNTEKQEVARKLLEVLCDESSREKSDGNSNRYQKIPKPLTCRKTIGYVIYTASQLETSYLLLMQWVKSLVGVTNG